MSEQHYPRFRQTVREAVEELDSATTNLAVRDSTQVHYPGTKLGTIQCHLVLCCVNQLSRVHYPDNQRPRVADDPRHDFLFRQGRGQLEWYRPERHGV